MSWRKVLFYSVPPIITVKYLMFLIQYPHRRCRTQLYACLQGIGLQASFQNSGRGAIALHRFPHSELPGTNTFLKSAEPTLEILHETAKSTRNASFGQMRN